MSERMIFPLGEGFLGFDPEEVKMLVALQKSPEWELLRDKVMQGMQEASSVSLRSTDMSLDAMRVQQGRIQALIDIAHLVDTYAPEWYKHPERKGN